MKETNGGMSAEAAAVGPSDEQLLGRIFEAEEARIARMRVSAEEELQRPTQDWTKEFDSEEDWRRYASMVAEDARDSASVLSLGRSGAWKDAYAQWGMMDTCPRDKFTEGFYAVMFGRNGKNSGNFGEVDPTLSVKALLQQAIQQNEGSSSFYAASNVASLKQLLDLDP